MKILALFTSILFVFACQIDPKTETEIPTSSENSEQKSKAKESNLVKTTWIESFREFRDAIYQDDLKKLRTFFDFPLNESQNEIWFLALHPGEEEFPDLSRPFTEEDFDEHYKNIFPKEFIQTILKIKTKELFENETFKTIEIKIGQQTFIMYADYHSDKQFLNLNLYSEELMQEEDHNIEFSINYQFVVDKNNIIKFKRIQMAG